MSNKFVLFGKVDAGGKLAFNSPEEFARARAQLRGRDVKVELSIRRNNRSDRQNDYYWGVVIPLLCEHFEYVKSDAGRVRYSKDDMHDALKCKFLLKLDSENGLARVGSTATLTTVEFEEYLTDIREWASTEGVFIPEPNEEIY